jgi:AcrR family transcriptional regulator
VLPEIAAGARVFNHTLGVTGRLLVVGDEVVQVIEGHETAVGAIFARIVADARHEAVRVLLDAPVADRYFHGYSLDVATEATLTDAQHLRLTDAIAQSRTPHANLNTEGWRLLDAMAGVGPAIIHAPLRTPPRQNRAQLTVDKLLGMTRTLGLRDGMPALTVEKIADASGVTHQAAYRYFATAGDMVRAVLRQSQARTFHQFNLTIRGMDVVSDADLAHRVASYVSAAFLGDRTVARPVLQYVLRHYHEINFGGIAGSAVHLREAMERCGLNTSDPGLEANLAAGLAGVAAAAKITGLRDPALLRTPGFVRTCTGIFLGALRGPAVLG